MSVNPRFAPDDVTLLHLVGRGDGSVLDQRSAVTAWFQVAATFPPHDVLACREARLVGPMAGWGLSFHSSGMPYRGLSSCSDMTIPREGDTIVRTADGARFTITEVVQAGGENLYRLQDGTAISEASFVREHDEAEAAFRVVR